MDAAAAAYLALTADGTDTLLMAADHALRRELSRRVRDDLIRLGIVQPGPTVRIADGAAASPGDLIICTQNDHSIEASCAGRRPPHRPPPLDRPAVPCTQITAAPSWATPSPTTSRKAAQCTRAWPSPKLADPAPGPRPAPELARYDQKHAERSGLPAPATPPAPAGEPLAVLSAVLDRDGQLLSATQARHHALTDADHLTILNAIWTAETTPAREQRYKNLLMTSLPPGYRREPGHQAKWLWRTLRAAELVGLDPGKPWPLRSPNGTWPEPATFPASSTPASATASAPWSRSPQVRGLPRSRPSSTPNAGRSPPRSPR